MYPQRKLPNFEQLARPADEQLEAFVVKSDS
jgi:hypothetical protein